SNARRAPARVRAQPRLPQGAAAMNCEQALQRIRDYADRELSSGDAAAVERHCAACPSCGAALRAQLDLKHVLRARFRRDPAPAPLSGGVARIIQDAASRQRSPARLGRRGAFALTIVVGLVVAASLLRSSLLRSSMGRSKLSPMAEALIDDHVRMLSAS